MPKIVYSKNQKYITVRFCWKLKTWKSNIFFCFKQNEYYIIILNQKQNYLIEKMSVQNKKKKITVWCTLYPNEDHNNIILY